MCVYAAIAVWLNRILAFCLSLIGFLSLMWLGIQPIWPQVRCWYCNHWDHWRQMVMKERALHIQGMEYDAEDQWERWHVCVRCEAWMTGQSEAAVKASAFRRPIEHKRLRAQRYLEVKKKHSQQWGVLSNTGRKMLLRKELLAMFEPVMEYIAAKREAIVHVQNDVTLHYELQQRLKESSSLEEDEEIYKAMSQLERDDKYIAYKEKGVERQHAYIRASSYQDEWVNSRAGLFVSFFICLANTPWDQRAQCATKCRRIIPSKRWQKKKDDTHSQLPELSAVPGQLGQAVGCTRSETLMAGLRR